MTAIRRQIAWFTVISFILQKQVYFNSYLDDVIVFVEYEIADQFMSAWSDLNLQDSRVSIWFLG